jgi:membrane protein YqaA with SNARE-associated domain
VHTSGFGSYKQLLPVVALLNLVAQAIAIVGIVTAIFTGNNNIFSAPEYAFGADGKTWFHVAAHVFIGTTIGSLVPWAIGSGILAATRKLKGSDSKIKSLA